MNLSLLRIALKDFTVQRLLLVALVVFTFWDGRVAFQELISLLYLHHVSQFSDFWDIVVTSPSWNRTQFAGDFIFFRPLLYLQLGLFYYFFGYNFFLWQVASLFLHILSALGLHSLLFNGNLKRTIYPLLIALLFGSSYMASEIVFWSHISGYLTFSALAVFSVLFIVRFLSTGNAFSGWAALTLGILSEFAYELGVLLNLLVSAVFFYMWIVEKCQNLNNRSINSLSWFLLFIKRGATPSRRELS